MDRIFGYIFSKLRDSELAVKRVSNNMTVLTLTGLICMAVVKKHINDQNIKIDNLTKEVEELKNKEKE